MTPTPTPTPTTPTTVTTATTAATATATATIIFRYYPLDPAKQYLQQMNAVAMQSISKRNLRVSSQNNTFIA